MSLENLITVSKHDQFRDRIDLLNARVVVATLLSDQTAVGYNDRVNAAYDALLGKIPLDAIAKLVLADPSIRKLAEEDETGTGVNIPDEAIIAILTQLLGAAAASIAVRRAGG